MSEGSASSAHDRDKALYHYAEVRSFIMMVIVVIYLFVLVL